MRLVTIVSDDLVLLEQARGILRELSSFENLDPCEVVLDPRSVAESNIVLAPIGLDRRRRLDDLNWIRERHSGALVLLTRDLSRAERLEALGAGVDQALCGPPDNEELPLVLKNLVRLVTAPDLRARADDPGDPWVLDQKEWRLRTPSGEELQLQRAELTVLALLLARPGTNQPRDVLAASFKSDGGDKSRSLDVVISKVRKKIRDASGLNIPLRSVRGVGYTFVGNARLVSVEAGGGAVGLTAANLR